MIRTDIFRRGVPWMLLIKRTGHDRDRLERQGRPESVRGTHRCGTPGRRYRRLRSLGLGGRLAGPGIDRSFEQWFLRVPGPAQGAAFAAGALPLHLIYYCCCGLSVAIAEYFWLLQRRRDQATPDRAAEHDPRRPWALRRFPEPRGALRWAQPLVALDEHATETPSRRSGTATSILAHTRTRPCESESTEAAFPIGEDSAGSAGSCSSALSRQTTEHQFTVFVDQTIGGGSRDSRPFEPAIVDVREAPSRAASARGSRRWAT